MSGVMDEYMEAEESRVELRERLKRARKQFRESMKTVRSEWPCVAGIQAQCRKSLKVLDETNTDIGLSFDEMAAKVHATDVLRRALENEMAEVEFALVEMIDTLKSPDDEDEDDDEDEEEDA